MSWIRQLKYFQAPGRGSGSGYQLNKSMVVKPCVSICGSVLKLYVMKQ